MASFKVFRESWLRGEGSVTSLLYRPADQRMCCLGQIAFQAGVPLQELAHVGALVNVSMLDLPQELNPFVHEHNRLENSDFTSDCMRANDTFEIKSDDAREARLKGLMATAGVEIEFVDGVSPWLIPEVGASCPLEY